jgi:hypothetical protein
MGCHVVIGMGKDEQGIFSIMTLQSAASAISSRGVIHRVCSGLYARSRALLMSDIAALLRFWTMGVNIGVIDRDACHVEGGSRFQGAMLNTRCVSGINSSYDAARGGLMGYFGDGSVGCTFLRERAELLRLSLIHPPRPLYTKTSPTYHECYSIGS